MQMDGELAVGLFIACVLECGCKFVNITFVTVLQKSSECRKWTRAGTCCPKQLINYQFRQSVFDGATFFYLFQGYLLPVSLIQTVPVLTVNLQPGWKRRVQTRKTCGQHL